MAHSGSCNDMESRRGRALLCEDEGEEEQTGGGIIQASVDCLICSKRQSFTHLSKCAGAIHQKCPHGLTGESTPHVASAPATVPRRELFCPSLATTPPPPDCHFHYHELSCAFEKRQLRASDRKVIRLSVFLIVRRVARCSRILTLLSSIISVIHVRPSRPSLSAEATSSRSA